MVKEKVKEKRAFIEGLKTSHLQAISFKMFCLCLIAFKKKKSALLLMGIFSYWVKKKF